MEEYTRKFNSLSLTNQNTKWDSIFTQIYTINTKMSLPVTHFVAVCLLAFFRKPKSIIHIFWQTVVCVFLLLLSRSHCHCFKGQIHKILWVCMGFSLVFFFSIIVFGVSLCKSSDHQSERVGKKTRNLPKMIAPPTTTSTISVSQLNFVPYHVFVAIRWKL